MQQMRLYAVSLEGPGDQPFLLLKDDKQKKFLALPIDYGEAALIVADIQSMAEDRPATHDLLTRLIGELDIEVAYVAITERSNASSRYFASIRLAMEGGDMEIDSRPGEAVALALGADVPIFVADEIVAESAVEAEETLGSSKEVLEEFRAFLEAVRPEDFGT